MKTSMRLYKAMSDAERRLCLATDRFEAAFVLHSTAPRDACLMTELQSAKRDLHVYAGEFILDQGKEKV